MENSLKQRIIGAIVLIALAIIFLPAILKEKVSSGTFVSKIPEKPKELENYQIDTQKIDDLIAEQKKVEKEQNKTANEIADINVDNKGTEVKSTASKDTKIDTTATDSSSNTSKRKSKQSSITNDQTAKVDKTSDLESTKAKISEKYRDAAWVVQVASFANESNAKKMVTKLKGKNYKAYRRKVQSGNKTVFRVFVGPYIEKKDAEKAISGISKLSESTAVLRAFDPIKH